MWHRPQLLNTVADLLFAAGAAMLLVAAAVGVLRMPPAPIRGGVLERPLQYVHPLELEEVLQGRVRGNFLSLSLDGVRDALESLPWVRKAQVRRVWPNRLVVRLEEHQPAARWGDSGQEWVNTYGEVFAASLPEAGRAGLPLLKGPPGTAAQLLSRYGELRAALQPLGLKPVAVLLSSRLAMSLQLDNGMVLALGREQSRSPASLRLKRFIDIYPAMVAGREPRPATVDLRYPNGFALYPAGTLPEHRGKE
ncbi:MAG: cell division protein FtsQ/DivIB [Azovibrio sp.]|nr:cell division protein FtsQ/DivIB [Azovibrio sp.]